MKIRMVDVVAVVVSVALSLSAALAGAQEPVPDYARRVVALVNAERRARGIPELRVSSILTQAAQAHAQDQLLRNYFEHDTPEGVTPSERMVAAGYDPSATLGENIYNAWGNPTIVSPETAVAWWMNSPGHRANILDPRFVEIGVGVAARPADGMHAYVQNFGSAANREGGGSGGGWGAIAFAAQSGIYGAVANRPTEAEARADALATCARVAQGCVVAVSYRNGCAAIKRDAATHAWGAGFASGSGMPAINAAGNFAREGCVQSGGRDCNELVVATCSAG